MCEAALYLLKAGKEELVLEGVNYLESNSDHIKITTLLGEEKVLSAKVKRFSLLNHKIVVEPC